MTIFTVTKLEKMQPNSFWFDTDRRANPDSLGKKRGFAAGRNHLPPEIGRTSPSLQALRRSTIVRAVLASTCSLGQAMSFSQFQVCGRGRCLVTARDKSR